jgi:hypothetical protein
MRQLKTLTSNEHHALGSPSLQKFEPNDPLFFINYLVSFILLEQQKMDWDTESDQGKMISR